MVRMSPEGAAFASRLPREALAGRSFPVSVARPELAARGSLRGLLEVAGWVETAMARPVAARKAARERVVAARMDGLLKGESWRGLVWDCKNGPGEGSRTNWERGRKEASV